MSINTQKLLSIVTAVRNEEKNIPIFYDRILNVMSTVEMTWELIFVYDESDDNTFALLLELHQKDPRVKILALSRGFGKENAMTAGLDYARGDAAVVIDADLQDPPEVMVEMVDKWQEGYQMVYGVRSSREGEGWLKQFSAKWFYRTMQKVSTVPIPQNTGDFRLLDRVILDKLQTLKETQRFMKGLFMVPGYAHTAVHYERPPREAGESNFGFWKLWNFAIDGITSFSLMPLKLASILGSFILTLSLLWAVILLFGNSPTSCDMLLPAIGFFSGVQLISIGILGEYVGRIYFETKQRPLYFVKETYGLNETFPKDKTSCPDKQQV